MRDRSARFDRVITGSHQIASRVDILFNRQVVLSDVAVESGEVTFDRTASVMARCMVRVAEPARIPTVGNAGPLSPYGYELQIYRGVAYQNGGVSIPAIPATVNTRVTQAADRRITQSGDVRITQEATDAVEAVVAVDAEEELLSLGVFPIQKSTFDGVTLVGDIEGMDRAQLVIDAIFEEDYVVAVGTNTGTAIQTIIEAGVPGLTFAFQSTTFTTPSVVFTAGDNRWEAARALAKSIGSEVYFDGVGRCVLREEPGAQSEPALIVRDGEGGTLTAVTLDLDRAPAVNRVIATGEAASNAEVYRGVATDDDPESPTYYDGPFGRKAMTYVSNLVTSNEQAAAVAAAVLTAYSGVARSIAVSSVPNPALEPGDVIQITRSGLNIDELYIIDGFTIGLRADVPMGMEVF